MRHVSCDICGRLIAVVQKGAEVRRSAYVQQGDICDDCDFVLTEKVGVIIREMREAAGYMPSAHPEGEHLVVEVKPMRATASGALTGRAG